MEIEIKEVTLENPPAKKETRELKLNLDFSIKDYDSTRAKHESRIRTLGAKGVKYNDIIDTYTQDNIIGGIVGGTQWYLYYGKLDSKKQCNVKQIKTLVNYQTKTEIERNLKYYDVSKWYSTAFYVSHYKRINALMKRITKELLKNYLRGA